MSALTPRLALLTLAALVAFAANSLLCRMALADGAIDPTTFSVVRVLAGALVLVPLALRRGARLQGSSWASGLALFAYAITFSWAYVSLGTGMGALLLFGAVQATMIVAGLLSGERPRVAEWLGGGAAFAGLVYLLLPGISAPPLWPATWMLAAGISWGIYSLRGRGARDATCATAGNFARALPLVLLAGAVNYTGLHASAMGLLLAATSGALTSGLGYAVWYSALRGHSATSAAIVQLAVPLLAALAGVWVLDEKLTLRLGIAALLILGGVLVAVLGRRAGPPFARDDERVQRRSSKAAAP